MEINDIIRLIEAVSENGLTSFVLEEEGSRLAMKKSKDTIVTNNTVLPAANPFSAGADAGAAAMVNAAMANAAMASAGLTGSLVSTGAAAAETAVQSAPAASIDSDKVVTSPLVGTFYDAPSPDADSFVKVGDVVKKGQVLGIIEAMKLMNEIESEFDGVVEAVLVKAEEVVEYGQPLFRIK